MFRSGDPYRRRCLRNPPGKEQGEREGNHDASREHEEDFVVCRDEGVGNGGGARRSLGKRLESAGFESRQERDPQRSAQTLQKPGETNRRAYLGGRGFVLHSYCRTCERKAETETQWNQGEGDSTYRQEPCSQHPKRA